MKLTRRETLTLAAAATVAGLAGFPTLALAKEGDVIDQLKLMAPGGHSGQGGRRSRRQGDGDRICLADLPALRAVLQHRAASRSRTNTSTTGKVKFILRPFARNTMDAAIFMLAEAAAQAAEGNTSPAAAAPSSRGFERGLGQLERRSGTRGQ